MKKSLIIILFFAANLMTAQTFQGIAIYKSSQDVNIIPNGKIDQAAVNQINEQLKGQFDKEYSLKFTKKESLYEEVESLEKPVVQQNQFMMVSSGTGKPILYKNTSEASFVRQEELMGKKFLVKDQLKLPEWKLEGETKKIGNYTCYKATTVQKREKLTWTKEEGAKKTTVEFPVTAWYTPDIPVNTGPRNYWGLPGLILEIQEDQLSLLCVEIRLNPEDKFEINIPSKGKVITSEAFEKLSSKKRDAMVEELAKGKSNQTIQIRKN